MATWTRWMLVLKKSTRPRGTGENVRKRWGMRRGARLWSHSMTDDSLFFFGLRCARHNDSGSHEDMLNWSSVDNSIAQIGQWTKRKQKQNKQTAPTTKPKPTKADQSMKVRQVKHVCALTTWCIAQKPRLSQHLQQLVECHTSNN